MPEVESIKKWVMIEMCSEKDEQPLGTFTSKLSHVDKILKRPTFNF